MSPYYYRSYPRGPVHPGTWTPDPMDDEFDLLTKYLGSRSSGDFPMKQEKPEPESEELPERAQEMLAFLQSHPLITDTPGMQRATGKSRYRIYGGLKELRERGMVELVGTGTSAEWRLL